PCLNLQRTILHDLFAVKRDSNRPAPGSSRVTDRLESVTVLAHDEPPSIPEEREDVVADVAGMRMPGQIFFRQPHQLKLLGPIDGLESFAGGQALSRLDLHERERLASTHDQINLAGPHTDVAPGDRVTPQTIEPSGAALTERAQLADVETPFEKHHLR